MTRKIKPLIHLEQLEPRILLSGDSLFNITPNPQQDTFLDNLSTVVQEAELLDKHEQVEEQISLELPQSDTPNNDYCQPLFTLLVDGNDANDELSNMDLKIANISPTETGEVLAVLSIDYKSDKESKVITTEDGSMPTYINDTVLSEEYAKSIEIRGPPARNSQYSITSNLSSYASSDKTFGTSGIDSIQQVKTPDLPGLVLVDPDPSNLQGQVIFLDFDGGTDITYNGPVVVEGINIPEFSADATGLGGQEPVMISQILAALEQKFEGTGVLLTTTEPDPGTSYSTIFIGGDNSALIEYGSFFGLAEQIDVVNQIQDDRAFVFTDNILQKTYDVGISSSILSEVIAHEVAHLLGYKHARENREMSSHPLSPVAMEYVVDSLEDTVEIDGTITLREAIEASNTNAPVGDAPAGSSGEADVISFDSSLAGGTIFLDGSELSVTDDLHILGLGSEMLTIDAAGQSRVFRIEGTETDVILDGLTISGGSTSSSGGGLYISGGTVAVTDSTISGNSAFGGGGLYVANSTVTFANSTISENSASGDSCKGGGLLVSQSTVTLTNSVVSGNSAFGSGTYKLGWGGGIYIYSGIVTLTNSTVSGNSAFGGGGLYVANSTITFANSTISENSVSGDSCSGGGLVVNQSTVTLTNSELSNNHAYGWYSKSGGLFVYSGTVTLTNSTVSGNSARGYGGGIYISDGTVVIMYSTVRDNSVLGSGWFYGGGIYISGGTVGIMYSAVRDNSGLSGNGAFYGGGIYISGEDTSVALTNSSISMNSAAGSHSYGCGLYVHYGTVTLTNSTISMNSASGSYYYDSDGGGLYVSGGIVTLTNSTVSGNSALRGGGLNIFSGTVVLNNTIIAGNMGYNPDLLSRLDFGEVESTSGHNFIGDATGLIGITDGMNGNIIGGGDPLFVRSPSPGLDGQWGTDDDDSGDLHLQPDSPCINTGNNSLAIDADGNPLTNDLQGYPRIFGGTVDIGAYEFSTFVVRYTRPRYIGDSQQIQIELSEPIDPVSLTDGDISLIDSGGSGVLIDVTVVDLFARVEIREALSPGIYTLVMSPSIQSATGNKLDQNLNGTGGEPEDECLIEVHVGVWAPRVLGISDGDMAGTVDSIEVYFSRPIDPASFLLEYLTITDPGGNSVAVTSVDQITGSHFKVNFLPQTDHGIYTVRIKPWIEGIDGTKLDQNRDGLPGSLDDLFVGTFQIVEVDLQFSNVAVNTDVLIAGELVMVTWSGHNAGGAALYGSWTDGVYLSANDQLDTSDQLLGAIRHEGGLEQDAEYMGSATVAVPGVLPGDYYILVRGDMRNEEIEGAGEQNNIGVSAQMLPLEFTVLTVDIPLGDVFEYFDQSKYYIITVPADEALQVVLDDLDDLGHNELYIR